MLKKLRELFTQKGQGTVEYALILGFVAIIAVYMLTGSDLKDTLKTNVDNAKSVGTSINTEYGIAAGTIQVFEGGGSTEPVNGAPGQGNDPPVPW